MFNKISQVLSGLGLIRYLNNLADYVDTSDINASRVKGQLNISNIPPAGLDIVVKVNTINDMLALTNSQVQTGDTVMVIGTTPAVQYVVVDDTKLGTMKAFQEYAAGTATKALSDMNGNQIDTTYMAKNSTFLDNTFDIDTLNQGGFYTVAAGNTKLPTVNESQLLVVPASNSQLGAQIAIDKVDNKLYIRSYDTQWSNWEQAGSDTSNSYVKGSIGSIEFTFNKNIPEGKLPLIGGVYDREAYKPLWEWVQAQEGLLIDETEWQNLNASQNGNVPYYSSGTDESTFRVPCILSWTKGTNILNDIGNYLDAGLPNITGEFYNLVASIGEKDSWGALNGEMGTALGAFATKARTNNAVDYAESPTYTADPYRTDGISFDASRSSAIYGNSTTVQPESLIGVWLVNTEEIKASVYNYKGSVASYSDLPTISANGDAYIITNTDSENNVAAGDTLIWSGRQWDNLGNYSNIFQIASQAEAEAGTNNSRVMTPLRTKQAIDVNAKAISSTFNLTSSGWSGGVRTLTNSNLGFTFTTTDLITMLPTTTTTAEEYDMIAKAKIISTSQSANSITLKCLGDVPTDDISVVFVKQGGA